MERNPDHLDEPTKINATFEEALGALLNDPELDDLDDEGAEDA
jgi:hypothetical protein